MPVKDLQAVDLQSFIAANAAPDALWVLLHIPKTAGSSLSAELNSLMPPYRNIHLLEEHYRRTDLIGDQFWAQLDPVIEAMIADDRTEHFRSASGHLRMRQANIIRDAIPRTKLFTFLRSPVRRIVSDYNYQRSEQHPAWEEFSAKFPTLDVYVENAAEHNKMYRYLQTPLDECAQDLIERVEREFTFVGIVEMYPLSFNILTRLFGLNYLPSQRLRTGRAEYEDVPLALRERIAEVNDLDLALYEHFHGLLLQHRAAWQSLIEADPGQGLAP